MVGVSAFLGRGWTISHKIQKSVQGGGMYKENTPPPNQHSQTRTEYAQCSLGGQEQWEKLKGVGNVKQKGRDIHLIEPMRDGVGIWDQVFPLTPTPPPANNFALPPNCYYKLVM